MEPPQEEQKHAGPDNKAVPFTQGQAGGARTHARGTQDGGWAIESLRETDF